jgi:hypothetical protein
MTLCSTISCQLSTCFGLNIADKAASSYGVSQDFAMSVVAPRRLEIRSNKS